MTKTTNNQKKRTAKPQAKQLTVGDLMDVRGGQRGDDDDLEFGGGKTEPKGFSKDGLA